MPGRRRRRVSAALVRGRRAWIAALVPLGSGGRSSARSGCLGRPARRPSRGWSGGSRRSSARLRAESRRRRSGSAARSLDALGEFAAGAGHELNNPLAVIVGRAQLLLARAKDPEVVRSLRIILNQAQRAHRILRDLMFVARPPAPRPRPCRPAEVLGSILGEFERECAARGVRLVSDLDVSPRRPGPIPTACGISPRSCSAMHSRPRRPEAGSRSARAGDGELIWSFSDTGKGIGAGEAAHLSTRSSAGDRPAAGWALDCPAPPGSWSRRAASSAGPPAQAMRPSFRSICPLTPPPSRGIPARPAGPRRQPSRQRPAENLGTRCPHDHRVGQVVALDAEEGHVERLTVIPVMPFQAGMPTAPGTDLGPAIKPSRSPRAAAYRADRVRIRRGFRLSRLISR